MDKIQNALKSKTGKTISLVSYESKRSQNLFSVYASSLIYYSVKDLQIFIFTKE